MQQFHSSSQPRAAAPVVQEPFASRVLAVGFQLCAKQSQLSCVRCPCAVPLLTAWLWGHGGEKCPNRDCLQVMLCCMHVLFPLKKRTIQWDLLISLEDFQPVLDLACFEL